MDEVEIVEGELVRAEPPRGLERVRAAVTSPRVQAAASAATGFVVGATTFALMKRFAGGQAETAPQPWAPSDPLIRPGTYLVHIRLITPRPPDY